MYGKMMMTTTKKFHARRREQRSGLGDTVQIGETSAVEDEALAPVKIVERRSLRARREDYRDES